MGDFLHFSIPYKISKVCIRLLLNRLYIFRINAVSITSRIRWWRAQGHCLFRPLLFLDPVVVWELIFSCIKSSSMPLDVRFLVLAEHIATSVWRFAEFSGALVKLRTIDFRFWSWPPDMSSSLVYKLIQSSRRTRSRSAPLLSSRLYNSGLVYIWMTKPQTETETQTEVWVAIRCGRRNAVQYPSQFQRTWNPRAEHPIPLLHHLPEDITRKGRSIDDRFERKETTNNQGYHLVPGNISSKWSLVVFAVKYDKHWLENCPFYINKSIG